MYNDASKGAVIKVIGVGGAGSNAVANMIAANVNATSFAAVNTDLQALSLSPAEVKIQIGVECTKGLGAGSNPDVGEKAAEETKDTLLEFIQGTDLLFIAAGMGGGTGTGAAPVIARLAKELGILTVAVVTKPFSFEGRVRNENAVKGIANLKKHVDTLVVIPNDKLIQVLPASMAFVDAFKVADDLLKQGISGIVDLITTPSHINLDFADISTIMRHQGLAHMGIGVAKGENRIVEAVRQAVSSPLLETTIEGARGVILNVAGGKSLGIGEVSDAANLVRSIIDESANIIFGTTLDESLGEEVKITVIATGFNSIVEENKVSDFNKNDFIQPNRGSVEVPFAFELEKETPTEEVVEEVAQKEEEIIVQPEPIVEEPVEKKKELPAFMKKLFGKK